MKNSSVIILENEIEYILEKVYSVNESLSHNQRNLLVQGFEDGINELFGKWAAKAMNFKDKLVGATKQVFTNMANKGKEYYEKGKKLAGDAWDSIVKFKDNVVNGIKEGYAKAIDFISTSYVSFKQALSNAYRAASKSIEEAYKSMKDKMEAFAETVKGIWTDIIEECALLYHGIKEKLMAMKDNISSWFEKNKKDLQQTLDETKSSGMDSLKSLGEKASEAWTKTKQVASDVAAVALYICVQPIIFIINAIKGIPGVYESAIKMVKEFIDKEVAEYNQYRVKENLKYIQTFERFKY
jgi:gas vesicle protein